MKIEMDFSKEPNVKKEENDSIVLDKPLEDVQEFEQKLKEYEKQGHDEIRELAKQRTIEKPELIEKDKDPFYNFYKAAVEGKISKKKLKSLSKSNCKKCYGRGHEGHQVIKDKKIPVVCRCIVKKMKNEPDLLEKIVNEVLEKGDINDTKTKIKKSENK